MDKKRRNKSIAELPHEVEMEILAKLPVKTLYRFQAVCSTWRKTIESPEFRKLWLKNPPVERVVLIEADSNFHGEFDKLYVDGKEVVVFELCDHRIRPHTSGGVLLLVGDRDTTLWNPSTGKTRGIPPLPCENFEALFYGFHYYPISGRFKILIVGQKQRDPKNLTTAVFDFDSNSWKTVDVPSHLNDTIIDYGCQLRCTDSYIHGGFHFIGEGWVLHLSLDGEITTRFRPPPQIVCRRYTTAIWGGRLCLVELGNETDPYEVWTMEEYGNADSWNRVFSVPHVIPKSPIPFSPLKNGCRMVAEYPRKYGYYYSGPPMYLLGNGHKILVRNNSKDLYVHDLDTDVLTQFPVPDFSFVSHTVLTYTETLFGP